MSAFESGLKDERLEVRRASVGWGKLQIDGTLGYDGGCCPVPTCTKDLRDASLVSAHAPSFVEIETTEWLEVFGFLNASARLEPNNSAEFWVNWNFLGELSIPGTATGTFRLAPGRHELVVGCASPHSRHTLWALRRAAPTPPRALTCLTIAAYPRNEIPSELMAMGRSARRHGVELKVCFAGERYASHTEMKVRRLRAVVESLETPLVAYVDARDCIFVAGSQRIEEQFRSLDTPICVATEAQCWPVRDSSWAERFPRHPTGCNWINAGQWMGERHAVAEALGRMEEIAAISRRHGFSDDVLSICSRLPEDDQLLWQAAWLGGRIEASLDYEGRVFRNVNTLDTSLVDNRDFSLNGRAVFKASGRAPCVLHFSGAAAQHCMHQWAGFLGALGRAE